jgi:hypothetical protein
MHTSVENILFVAMSHSLTNDQIEDARNVFDIKKIVTLAESNPQLSKIFSQVPASWDLDPIIDLSESLVKEAIKAAATHFYCVGQPSLAIWANLIASGNALHVDTYKNRVGEKVSSKMKCIESTTERTSEEQLQSDGTVLKTSSFRHIRWREVI